MVLTPYQIWYLGVSTFPAILYAILYLGQTRLELYAENLFDPYYQVNEKYPVLETECTNDYLMYRAADGRCNNLEIPSMGMRGNRFGRNTNTTNSQVLNKSHLLLHPHPLKLNDLMRRKNGKFIESPNINLLAAAWIQFQTHDWFIHSTSDNMKPIEIPDFNGKTYFKIQPTSRDSMGFTFNEVTHWWDASMLYGSNSTQQEMIRTFENGKLVSGSKSMNVKFNHETGLPITAVTNNWWIGSSLMHRIFISEHNYLAGVLTKENPTWNDEELFQHVRLIIAAILAKIHTVEWTPTVLNNPALRAGMNINWFGINRVFNYTTEQIASFGIPASAIPILQQVQKGVGGKSNLYNRSFSITEEFTSVYRMHPLLPDTIELRPIKFQSNASFPKISIAKLLNRDGERQLRHYGIANWLNTFGYARAGHLVFNNYPEFLTNLKLPDGRTINLGVVDIVRDRERLGIRYNELRRQLRLEPITSFANLSVTPDEAEELAEIYENDVELLDLLVGLMAEANWPAGYGFSNTAFQIFVIMASRRLETDRFYKEYYNPDVYTSFGIQYIEQTNFKDILLRHMPCLRRSLENITNVFAPW